MNKFIRIQIDSNASYLVYQRGMVYEMTRISDGRVPILKAMLELRHDIRTARSVPRDVSDKLAHRSNGHILGLLRNKRTEKSRECFDSKKPVTRHKYVGVEIEFCSAETREKIAMDLAMMGLEKYTHLKNDGSAECDRGENSGENCDGSCRENCECAHCGETHYCDDENDCGRRNRSYGSNETWEYREDCQDCTDTEYLDGCDCGGKDSDENICKGEHIVCIGHCPGHNCEGYDDHNDYDCNCECNCAPGGHEISIVAKSTEIRGIITKVCEVLKKHEAYVNKTCGLHVHLDARNADENRMFGNLVKSQKLLYSMVPKSRYTNSFCKPNTCGSSMTKYQGRYFGINPESYAKFKTIEVRLHSGTVDAEKINRWIELTQKIAYAKTVDYVYQLSDLTSTVKLSSDLIKYIHTRVEKFKEGHGSYSIDLGNSLDTDVEIEQAIAA
jgi:hypothetical protein